MRTTTIRKTRTVLGTASPTEAYRGTLLRFPAGHRFTSVEAKKIEMCIRDMHPVKVAHVTGTFRSTRNRLVDGEYLDRIRPGLFERTAKPADEDRDNPSNFLDRMADLHDVSDMTRATVMASLRKVPSTTARDILKRVGRAADIHELKEARFDDVVREVRRFVPDHESDTGEVSVSTARKNRVWAEHDVDFLKEYAGALSVEGIAYHLDRTISAIQVKACLLGLSLKVGRTQPAQVSAEVIAQREAFARWCKQTHTENSERGFVEWCERQHAPQPKKSKPTTEAQDDIWLPRIQAAFDKLLTLIESASLSSGAYDYLRQSYYARVFERAGDVQVEAPMPQADGLWQRRRRWSAADIVTLRKLAGKKPAHEIATRLGRTETGVRSYAHQNGISLELT